MGEIYSDIFCVIRSKTSQIIKNICRTYKKVCPKYAELIYFITFARDKMLLK